MQLYVGSGIQFTEEVVNNRIASKLEAAFIRHYGHRPSVNEVRSWQNSLRAVVNVLIRADVQDVGVILEYHLPLTSRRLDVLLTGSTNDGREAAVVIELKQWDTVEKSAITDCVTTFVGGGLRDELHPSVQTAGYVQFLRDFKPVFTNSMMELTGCSYLHNMETASAGPLNAPVFQAIVEDYPLFDGNSGSKLGHYLSNRVGSGDGLVPLKRLLESPHRPSKKLLQHTKEMVEGQDEFVLLDEQRIVFNAIKDAVEDAYAQSDKQIFVIKGGPGTGKSVIALQLLGTLSGQGYNASHATGSKAFTENLRRIVGRRAAEQLMYFNSYADAEPDSIDVLILDEAHRIRESSKDRYRPHLWSGLPQVDELLRAARVVVFFIDELQIVRPGEVGSLELIREAAARAGAALHEYELSTQFRCGGSDAFIAWIDNTLGIRETANAYWEADREFDLRIVDSVEELDQLIQVRASEGYTARLSAGFCWPWSKPNKDGTLVDDVKVGSWSRPWNAKSSAGRLAAGIPKEHFWASDPNGINQVGCVYTAQGFEYDYAGVIWGKDLTYELESAQWIADKKASADTVVKRSKEEFPDLVRHVYRVLLTRGMKGCYIYCMDADTATFLKSRIRKGGHNT